MSWSIPTVRNTHWVIFFFGTPNGFLGFFWFFFVVDLPALDDNSISNLPVLPPSSPLSPLPIKHNEFDFKVLRTGI